MQGSTSYNVRKGDSLVVSFQARPGVVITGGSQNLEFMNDPVRYPLRLSPLTITCPASCRHYK